MGKIEYSWLGKSDIARNISSEKERNKKKKWKKNAKKSQIPVDETVHCPIDKSGLPPDAVFKYTDTVIGQDIIFKRNNTLYLVDVYYSPSEKKTYRAPLPAGYTGYHGNGLKGFALTLHNVCDVTSNKILDLFHSIGCELSKGSLSSILLGNTDWLYNEKSDILRAGLSVSYAQVDATGSRVRGANYHTQIICNEYFTSYTTLQNKSRLDVLAAFQGLHDKNLLQLTYNEEAVRLVAIADICENDRVLLGNVFRQRGMPITLEHFNTCVEKELPELYNKPVAFTKVKEAFAFAYYHYQDEYPVIELLISDDASEYNNIATLFHALCWIHDGRNYKKLTPVIKGHQDICSTFIEKYWDYYHKLLEYKKNSSEYFAMQLEAEFASLFVADTAYAQLNTCIKRTLKIKEQLLGVLKYPNLPLHNNASELGARQKARKRDISLHTMTTEGTIVQDAWMTIVQTAKKLGVNIYEYITEKISNPSSCKISLAELIYKKALSP
ncbi:MAG: transposase [Chitinispirillaceae bacterium]|nr:transposase [Chitinispirillaceae bacterium]